MTILITGASGILGTPLIDHLLKQGHGVIGLCRNPPETEGKGVQWLVGDVSLPHLGLSNLTWDRLVQEVSTIFHLAARTDFKGQSLADYHNINVLGVRHIKELALAGTAWLHHVSTAFVCGDWNGVFCEDQLMEGQRFHNFYEESKYLGECELHNNPPPRFTVYRPAIILERKPTKASQSAFGPFVFLDGVFRICLAMLKRGHGLDTIRVAGNPSSTLPFIFDDDVAQTLSTLATTPSESGRTYNLTPQTPFANHILEKVFNQAFGRQAVALQRPPLDEVKPLTDAERILAKKTRMYGPYMDLAIRFSRTNLDNQLPLALAAISETDLLSAFSRFLATKSDLATVVSHAEAVHLHQYFGDFLEHHLGQPLIKNLSSLTACLQVEIKGYNTWSISIEKGVLTGIEKGERGDFGYTTDAETFLKVASGKLSPQQGFFMGAIQLVANPKEALRTATALEEFFREYPYPMNTQDEKTRHDNISK